MVDVKIAKVSWTHDPSITSPQEANSSHNISEIIVPEGKSIRIENITTISGDINNGLLRIRGYASTDNRFSQDPSVNQSVSLVPQTGSFVPEGFVVTCGAPAAGNWNFLNSSEFVITYTEFDNN